MKNTFVDMKDVRSHSECDSVLLSHSKANDNFNRFNNTPKQTAHIIQFKHK